MREQPGILETRYKEMADVSAQNTNKTLLKETLFAGITAVGGAALAFYTYQNSANPIWPVAYSAVSVLGTCNSIRNIKIFRISSWNESDGECSPMNVATGTIIYFSSLYAFSESWKCNHELWIPCLGLASSGLYFAFSSMYRMKSVSDLNPLLKCCELAVKPALIGLGATYLSYFRNHDEEMMQWLPLVLIFCNSLGDIAVGTLTEASAEEPKFLLLKGIELMMGGCLLAASSTVLTIYFSIKEYHWAFRAYMATTSFSSFFVLFASLLSFQKYLGMDERVLYFFACLTTGFPMILLTGLMVRYMGNMMVKCLFPILSASGYVILCGSVYFLFKAVPRSVIAKYCQRTLVPLFTIGSAVAPAYIGYHMGWQYSLMAIPLPCTGLYVAYKSFSRRNQAVRYSQRTLGPVLTVCSTVASAYVAYHTGWQYSLMVMPLTCAGIYATYKGFRRR